MCISLRKKQHKIRRFDSGIIFICYKILTLQNTYTLAPEFWRTPNLKEIFTPDSKAHAKILLNKSVICFFKLCHTTNMSLESSPQNMFSIL